MSFFKLFNFRKSNKIHSEYTNLKSNNTAAEKKVFLEISINKNQYLLKAYDCILKKNYNESIEILSEINESKNKKLMSEKYFLLACCYSQLKNKDLAIENIKYYLDLYKGDLYQLTKMEENLLVEDQDVVYKKDNLKSINQDLFNSKEYTIFPVGEI
jgi:phosphoribosyl-ATP pyrophosphohydrolase